MMRANRILNDDPDALTRRAVTAAVEREKETRRMEGRARPELDAGPVLRLRDEKGQAWQLTINSRGEISAVIAENDDGSAPTGR